MTYKEFTDKISKALETNKEEIKEQKKKYNVEGDITIIITDIEGKHPTILFHPTIPKKLEKYYYSILR